MSQNILLIDDSKVDRTLMRLLITKQMPSVNIYELSEGSRALESIISHKINIVILDLRMPGKDGYEILTELKNNDLTMDIPVIVCSAVMETESLLKILSLGAYDYFLKPLSEEVMKISLPLKVKNAIELSNRIHYISKQGQLDSLTELYNRNYFKKKLNTFKIGSHQQVSILMGDVNGLKIANDAFGCDIGDLFLVDLAKIIKSVCPTASICCRWGGDEFAVIIPDCPHDEIEAFAIEMSKQFSKISYFGLSLSIAFGWDTQKGPEFNLNKVLISAEDSMIRSKMLEDVSVRSNSINAIMNTLYEKNLREEAHSRRVSDLCQKMGSALLLGEKDMKDLKLIGMLHDIGKIAIEENILNKPGKLEDAEWQQIKRHPEIGHRILSSSPELVHFADIILCHHERIDGKGYPSGLKGDEIPVFSRILAIADSYDAMTCERTYKRVLNVHEASLELRNCAGKQFDGSLVEIFIDRVLGLA